MTKTRNKSVYNHGRKVHIDNLHGVTLCYAIAFLSIRLADTYLTLYRNSLLFLHTRFFGWSETIAIAIGLDFWAVILCELWRWTAPPVKRSPPA